MFLSEVLDQLEHGELFQIALGGDETNDITACNLPNVLPHINLALKELYKRFPLKIGDVIIDLHDQIQTYYLDPKYSRSNKESTEPIKYIHDSRYQPFKGGVNKIEFVYDEIGRELFLNNSEEYWSLYTPSYNAIQVPLPDVANSLVIHYRASHDNILLEDLDPKTEDVNIPPGYLEPLLFYVGSRIFTSLNGDQSAEGNNYMQKFEQSCAKISELNLMNGDNTTNVKLDKAGWV